MLELLFGFLGLRLADVTRALLPFFNVIDVPDSHLVGVGLSLPTLAFGFPGSRLGVAAVKWPFVNAIASAKPPNAGSGRVRPNRLGACFDGRRSCTFRRPLHPR